MMGKDNSEDIKIEKGFSLNFSDNGISIQTYLNEIDDVNDFVDELGDLVGKVKSVLGGSVIEKGFSLSYYGKKLSASVYLSKIEDISEFLDNLDKLVGKITSVVKTYVEKAVWSTSFINNLPDSSFAYVESGGKKDSDGKTTPRSLRHLPYKDASGKVDLPHLRNAIARAPQVKGISAEKAKMLQTKLQGILQDLSKSDEDDANIVAHTVSDNKPESTDDVWDFPILKADEDKRLVYGVVLEPDSVDAQNDVISADEIEKSAHQFMIDSRFMDFEHQETLSHNQAIPVESYIAPLDIEVDGENILKGSWVMVTYVPDDEVWEDIKKGEIKSYSIRGVGKRIER